MLKKQSKLYILFFYLIVLVGVFFRIKMYLFNPGLHCDEAMLALNVFDCNYFELFKPMQRLQVTPPLFLVLSKYFYRLVSIYYNYDFAALMLRFIPLLSGIIAIPAFGFLLNKIYKNRFLTLLGMLLLSVNACAISYSCIFKQYETEMLISIIILIIASSKIIKNNLKFIILGLTPFISLTSFFVLPGCLLNSLIKKELNLKGILYFLLPFVSFILFILLPIYNNHYDNMASYWNDTFKIASTIPNYIKINIYYLMRTTNIHFLGFLFFICSGIMIIKNWRLSILAISPILITYSLSFLNLYPVSERFLIFLLPCFLITAIFPLSLIPRKYYKKHYVFVYSIILFCIIIGIKSVPPLNLIHLKQEYGKEVWEYLDKTYDKSTPIIMGQNYATNLFYRRFFAEKFNYYDNAFINYKTMPSVVLDSLPKGTYYIILTRLDVKEAQEDLEQYLNHSNILEFREFISPQNSTLPLDAPSSLLIKLKK